MGLPVVYMRRTLTQDIELRGTKMAAGDKVSLWYCSANRDESKFADPWTFDLARNPNPHLGFGGGGAHFCLGANLASGDQGRVRRTTQADARRRRDRGARTAVVAVHSRNQDAASYVVLKGRTWLGGYMVRHSRWLWDLHYTGSVVAHPLADR